MNRVNLTVNGEPRVVEVPPRTQLAELLRDELNLTGTHLGCEQGVCGACTVVLNGQPIRSCITYAHACEGAAIETVEGFADDEIMQALRAAFSRHHALQCGFCTPGMLATSWDIVRRIPDPDEARIRRELSGNLCRCTGYMGIVAAVAEVAASHGASATTVGTAAFRTDGAAATGTAEAFTPFQPAPPTVEAASTRTSGLVVEDGWSSLSRTLAFSHPPESVWALFQNLELLLDCLPGAQLLSSDADRFVAGVKVRFGPIRAEFEGEGIVEQDPSARRGRIHGSGQDSRGGSRLRSELNFAVTPSTSDSSEVTLSFRFQLQGVLAQFNRADLVESFADTILAQFSENCRRSLAGETLDPAATEVGLRFMLRGIGQWIRQRFG